MKIIRHLLKPFLIFISFLTGFLHFLCIWKLFFCIDLCFVPLDVDFFKQTIVHSLHSICWIKRKTKNCCAVYSFMMDYQKLRIQLLKLYFFILNDVWVRGFKRKWNAIYQILYELADGKSIYSSNNSLTYRTKLNPFFNLPLQASHLFITFAFDLWKNSIWQP